jgi:hypothetical protein
MYRYTENQLLEIHVVDVETRARRRARLNLKGSFDRVRLERSRSTMSQAQIN